MWTCSSNPSPVQGYIYIEAYKESHVKDAVRGLRNIYSSKAPKLVPVKEMVDAITVNRKAKAMIGAAFELIDLVLWLGLPLWLVRALELAPKENMTVVYKAEATQRWLLCGIPRPPHVQQTDGISEAFLCNAL